MLIEDLEFLQVLYSSSSRRGLRFSFDLEKRGVARETSRALQVRHFTIAPKYAGRRNLDGVENMSEPKMVTTAVIISLVAGILIILGNVYTGSLYATIEGIGMIIGVVSGILVLISAIMLKIRPGEGERGLRVCCRWWGSLILVFSIVSLFGGTLGGFIGAILGIVGAALALVIKV
jgi:MFS family permease